MAKQITKPTLLHATPADCFRTYVQARVLGMRDFEWRCKSTQICLYAWEIALLPDATVREQQIELLWQTCEPLTPEQASQDVAASFMGDVRALVALKRELLPGVITFVDSVRLEAIDDKADRLVVTTSGGEETRLVHFSPHFTGTPSFGRRLYRFRDWTDDLADWVDRLRREGQLVGNVKREAAAIGGMMRVELTGCREVSTRFHSRQTAPSARRVTAEWVNLADEIDAQISKVLATLG